MFKNLLAGIGFLTLLLFVFTLVIMILAVSKLGGGNMPDGLTHLSKAEQKNVGVVELVGEIKDSKVFRDQIQKFVDNSNVTGIVVRVNSPGGAVGASEEIYRYIQRANEKKPVVCAMGNMAASGGLYASLGCQYVFTSAGTLTGSIGVIMMMPNFTGVMEKVGVGFNIVKTGKYKDSGSPFRSFDEADKMYFEGIASQAYEQFVGAISESRNIELATVKSFADGKVILGEQAVKLGLAHEIGGIYEAAEKVLELQGIAEGERDPHLVFPTKDFNFNEIFKGIPRRVELPFVQDRVMLKYIAPSLITE